MTKSYDTVYIGISSTEIKYTRHLEFFSRADINLLLLGDRAFLFQLYHALLLRDHGCASVKLSMLVAIMA